MQRVNTFSLVIISLLAARTAAAAAASAAEAELLPAEHAEAAAASIEPQQAGPAYSCVPAHDYAGIDLQSLNGQDSAGCRSSCSANADCTFYILNERGDCWLKSDFANGPNGGNWEAGDITEACIKLPTGKQPAYVACTTRRSFGGTALMPAFPTRDSAFCTAACSHRADCTAFEFTADKLCTLKTGTSTTSRALSTVSRTCRKQAVKLPSCQPGDGLRNGVCRPCDFLSFSAGGSMARCFTCTPEQRPQSTLRTCTTSAPPTCQPGTGLQRGACQPCASQTASSGGQGAVCLSCPANQAPNAQKSGCTPSGSTRGFTCVPRQDYAGTDLDSFTAGSADECIAACARRTDCSFVVYTLERTCWVKADFMNGPNGRTGPADNVVTACLKDEAVKAQCPASSWSYSKGVCCETSFDTQGNCPAGRASCSVTRSPLSTAIDCTPASVSPKCPAGDWQFFGPDPKPGFCCKGDTDGVTTCSGTSCAVDGNFVPDGRPYCSAVSDFQVLFLNLEWCDSGPGITDTAKLDQVLYDGPFSLQAFYPEVSRGRVWFDRTTSKVQTVKLPCDVFPMDKCDYDAWMAYIAENYEALGIPDYEDYPVRVSIAPGTPACGRNYAAVAGFAAGSGVFLHGWAALDVSIVKHELGHVQGLGHASWINRQFNKFEEYGDLTSPQGISCGECSFNAPEIVSLGWAKPPAERIVYWSTVKPGTRLSFRLQPLADNAVNAMVAIITTFDPATGRAIEQPNSTTLDVFLSYRVAKGQDGGLPEQYAQATSVHSTGRLGKFTGSTLLAAWLKSGQAFIDHFNQLVAWQVSGDDSGAEVVLCRYKSVPRDCGSGFVDIASVPQAAAGVAEVVAAAMAVRFGGSDGSLDGEVQPATAMAATAYQP